MDTESNKPSQEQQDLQEKIKCIQRIIHNCNERGYNNVTKDLKTLLYYFTGTEDNKETIGQVLYDLQAKMTFKEWDIARNQLQSAPIVSYEELRNAITDQYVNKLKVPTRRSIFSKISKLGYFPYTTRMFNHDLLKHGFKWKRLPNQASTPIENVKVILEEDTEQLSARQIYFHKIKEYRDSGKDIVHLEVVDMSEYNNRDLTNECAKAVLAASPNIGVFINDKVKTENLDEWLKNTLYAVPENAVFVVEPSLEFKEICELPTIQSHRSKMKKWLDCYSIPYDALAFKADLFALVQKYKGNCPPKYKYCEYLKSSGHDVIIRPQELAFTKYFDFLLQNIPKSVKNSLNFYEDFRKWLLTVPIDDFIKQDRIMAKKEMEIYDQDQKMELLIDKVIESFKYGMLSKDDLKVLECETALASDDIQNSFLCKIEK